MNELEHSMILKRLPFGYALHKIFLDDKEVPTDYEYVEVNDAFEKFTGLKKENVVGKKITEILPSIKNSEFDWIKYYGKIAINMLECEFEQYSEELERWYKIKVYAPKKYYFVTYFVDITNEIKEKELFRSTLLSIADGIIATDLDGKIIMINNTAERLTELEKNKVKNTIIFEVFNIFNNKGENIINGDIVTLLDNCTMINEEENLFLKSKSGIDIPIVCNICPIKDKLDKIYGMLISFRDITEKINKDKEINYMTYHDSLTDVYNRTFFNDQIKNIDIEKNLPISVIMGDVNGLKLTNDAFGHIMGDKLLKSAADIMKRICRKNDIVVRWGGDEFIILLPKTSYYDVAQISERIKQECLKENIQLLNISISLGYHTKKYKDEDIMKTVTNAEEMMYKIKMLESKSTKSRTLKLIVNTLHEKSEQDELHSKNTRKICKLIGEAIGMTKEKISELEILGEIHDIGKVAIPKAILIKQGKLTEEEWEEIKKHPQIGYHIVSSSSDISFLGESVLSHHEKYDGTGYPKGLKGEQIPFMARILSIADAYEAMVNYRTYREKITKEEAIQELIKNSGSQFDPELVRVFIDKVIKKL